MSRRHSASACMLVSALLLLLALAAFLGARALDLPVAASAALMGLVALSALAGGAAVLLSRQPARAATADPGARPASSPVMPLDDLVGMLDDTLLMARDDVTSGHIEPVDVGDLLSRMITAHDGTRLKLAGTRSPLITDANRAGLERVFEILIENALASGPNVSLWCDRGTEALVVHVDDDGPGVPRAERARVFEWRYYMTTPPSQRTGCRAELVVARQIVRTHGGDITAGASPLGGARFSVRLPLHAEEGAPALQAAS